jgi:hypothetical protein
MRKALTSLPRSMATRAVLRQVEPGNDAVCVHCRTAVKFAARTHPQQVIANVYVDGAWDRVEHYHEPCYLEAGAPYGEAKPAAAHLTAAARAEEPAAE